MDTTPLPISTYPVVTKTTEQTPDGLWLVTTTSTLSVETVITPVTPPTPTPRPPSIPANAISSGILDNAANWKQEKDSNVNGATSKVVSMSNVYDSTRKLRNFIFSGTGKPGVRWSNDFAKDTTHFNFCYRGKVQSPDWTQVQQLELDMNQTMPNGNNVFLCAQFDALSGTVQYTLTPSGSVQWFNSNIKHNMRSWPSAQWIPFEIYTHQDGKGNVVFDGLTLNGVYTAFDPSCKGVAQEQLNWPSGTLINNFQVNAFNDPNSNTTVRAQNLEVVRW